MRTGRKSSLVAVAWGLALALTGGRAAAAGEEGRSLRGEVERALVELEAWDTEGAIKILEGLVAAYPAAPETAWIRGKVLFEQGNYAGAVQAFDQAQELGGGSGPSLAQDRKLAQAALEETAGGTVVESAHFIATAKARKDALLLPWTLSGLEAAYAALTQDLGYAPPGKVRVEIYDAPKALAHVSPLTVAEIKASGTIALCKYNRLMITSPRALLRGYPWLDTLSHEFVHFLVTRKGRNSVPIWLHEGLAKFLETRWRGAPGMAVDELSLRLLEEAAKKKELIPFAAMHPSIAKLPTQEKAALAFAEVESAIRLLYGRGGQGALTELVAAMAAGFNDQRAVAQAYGKTFAQFEADWRADVARPRVKKPGEKGAGAAQKKLVFQDDVKGKKEDSKVPSPKDPAARRAVRLGEIFYGRGRWQAAALEYAKARALLPEEDVVVARRYAVSQLQLGNVRQAAEALEKAALRDVTEGAVQLLLGQVRLRLGDLAGARTALYAAVAVDPFDPALQTSLQKLGIETKDAALEARASEALKLLSAREAAAEAGGTPKGHHE